MRQISIKRIRDLVKLARAENLTRLTVGGVTIEPGGNIAIPARGEAVKDASPRRREIAQTLGISVDQVLSDEDLLPKAG